MKVKTFLRFVYINIGYLVKCYYYLYTCMFTLFYILKTKHLAKRQLSLEYDELTIELEFYQ